MEMTKVQSSSIAAIGYQSTTQRLTVEFTSGSTYVYEGVAQELHEQLMQAESKGKFFAANVRGKFHAMKVEKEAVAQ